MIQYIPKDALLAEIENLLDKGKYHDDDYNCAYRDGNNGALYALKGRIDTLEVKEVDLEKEIDDFITKEWAGIEEDNHFYNMIKNELSDIAKHFVEIGINLQKDNELA